MDAETQKYGVGLWVWLLYPGMEIEAAQKTAEWLVKLFPHQDWSFVADKAYRQVATGMVERGYWEVRK